MATRNISRLAIAAILLFSAQAQAQYTDLEKHFVKPDVKKPFIRPYGPSFHLSMGICAAGAVVDIHSSLSGIEGNPLLRNSSGGLSVSKAVLVKGIGCGWTLLLERKHPRAAMWARIIVGSIQFAVAARNYRL